MNAVVDVRSPSAPRRRSLLESVGLDPDAAIDPKLMVSDADYYALCERVTREDANGVTVPIRVGDSMNCDDYGAFGLAWKSAVDLRRSFERAERYGVILSSVSIYELRSENGTFYMTLHREGKRHLGLRISNEQTIVAITRLCREVSQRSFNPEAVYFKHLAPGDISAHETYFGCPVYFDSPRDALQVSEEALETPNKLGDLEISKFFGAHLENELSELSDETALAKRTRIQISQALSEGVPAITEIAGRLNMSARTLQRRLSEHGLSYQTLVDDSRRELAERLLKQTEYTLTEVAFLTGFSEQSAFARAFKRWAGQTPRSYRLGSG